MQTTNYISLANYSEKVNSTAQAPVIDLETEYAQLLAIQNIVRGDIGRAPIPFIHRPGSKVRPVLVLARQGEKLVVVPITSHAPRDEFDVPLLPTSLWPVHEQSTARCSEMITIPVSVVCEVVGHALPSDLARVLDTLACWLKPIRLAA